MKRRAIEIAVAAFGVVFLAYVIYSFRAGHRPSSGAARGNGDDVPPDAEAGAATTVLKGFDYTETVRGRPLFHIQSERTVGFGPAAGLLPNLYALEKVTLTVYPETGAPVTVNSDRATYDQRTNAARLSGNVHWLDGRGSLGETAEIEFQPSARLLVAPKPLRMTRGTFVLEARSGRYDVPKREAQLEGPVKGNGTGEGSGGLTALASDRALYKRDELLVELSGSVSGQTSTGSRIFADQLVLKTTEEGGKFDWARAEGHVHGTLQGVSVGGSAPENGGVRPARGLETFAGDHGGLLFAVDGSVRTLSLTGSPAAVDEAPAPGAPGGRKLRASTIDVALEGGHPRTARAQGSVHIETPDSRGDSDQGSLTFRPDGGVENLDLSGSVRMEGQGRSGRADRAVQISERAVWVLSALPGHSATVEGEGSRVTAAKIEIDQKHKGIRAEGAARAVLSPRQDGAKPVTPVGDASRPTFAKADRMTFDDASRVGTFSGSATLWQDASSVFGNDITVNDLERTLVATGNTRTVFAPAEAPAKTAPGGGSGSAAPPTPPSAPAPAVARRAGSGPGGDRHPSIVTANRLIYREAVRPPVPVAHERASTAPPALPPMFTPVPDGAVSTPPAGSTAASSRPAAPSTAEFEGSVVVTSAEWRGSAARSTAWIGADRRIDRIEMDGDVSFRDTKEGRTGRAAKATDFPAEGRTVLEGNPAWVTDREGNRVAGATLTIRKRGGSVEVTAPSGGRTETIHKTTAKPVK